MKKKETLWDLLKRLDEEAGQYSKHLSEANHYFDTASSRTKKVLDRHERDLHTTIGKVRRALRAFMRPKKKRSTGKD